MCKKTPQVSGLFFLEGEGPSPYITFPQSSSLRRSSSRMPLASYMRPVALLLRENIQPISPLYSWELAVRTVPSSRPRYSFTSAVHSVGAEVAGYSHVGKGPTA